MTTAPSFMISAYSVPAVGNSMVMRSEIGSRLASTRFSQVTPNQTPCSVCWCSAVSHMEN